jgi:hypothetical protein
MDCDCKFSFLLLQLNVSLKTALGRLSENHFLTYKDEMVCLTDAGRAFMIRQPAEKVSQKRMRSATRPESDCAKSTRPGVSTVLSDDNVLISDNESNPSISDDELNVSQSGKRRRNHPKTNEQTSTNPISVLLSSFRQNFKPETAAVPTHRVLLPHHALQVSLLFVRRLFVGKISFSARVQPNYSESYAYPQQSYAAPPSQVCCDLLNEE